MGYFIGKPTENPLTFQQPKITCPFCENHDLQQWDLPFEDTKEITRTVRCPRCGWYGHATYTLNTQLFDKRLSMTVPKSPKAQKKWYDKALEIFNAKTMRFPPLDIRK